LNVDIPKLVRAGIECMLRIFLKLQVCFQCVEPGLPCTLDGRASSSEEEESDLERPEFKQVIFVKVLWYCDSDRFISWEGKARHLDSRLGK
jgi:hypothetical protein